MHLLKTLKKKNFQPEFEITASRSQGPGGQHVNKVNTRIVLRFNVFRSGLLSQGEKAILAVKLARRLTREGDLVITSQYSRSQFKNKEDAVNKFYGILAGALASHKKRIATKPGKASIRKRLERKRKHAEKKQNRRNMRLDHT